MKYEYKILESNGLANEENLNKFGDEGWRLASIFEFGHKILYYLIREKA